MESSLLRFEPSEIKFILLEISVKYNYNYIPVVVVVADRIAYVCEIRNLSVLLDSELAF